MRPTVVGERRNDGNVRCRATPAWLILVVLGATVSACGSVSNGLPKNDAGAGGSAGSGAGGANGSGGAAGTGRGGAPGTGDAPGTGGAVMAMDAGADVADAPREGGAGCTGMQASCAAIHACDPTRASGNYMIAPDGPTDAAAVLAFCDMTVG